MGPRVLAITPEISQVGGPGLTHGNDAAVYLVHFGEHLAPCPVDVRLADGERFFLGQRSLQALHLPGHSPGSVAYVVESDGRRVVFAQDVHGPLHPDLLSKRNDYQASLRKLLVLEADILCEGHFGVFVGRAAVAAFIERFVED